MAIAKASSQGRDAKSRWVWREAGGDGAVDPCRLPQCKLELDAWLPDTGAWGPSAARLCAVDALGVRDETVMVKEKPTGKQFTVDKCNILPWFEGLLVLETLVRHRSPPDWFEDLRGMLDEERKKYNSSGKPLSASLYLQRILINQAITGPRFIDSKGNQHRYRRALAGKDAAAPRAGDPSPQLGLYRVQSLLRYLPPWEAFVHPKCRLYQDFYLVQWAAPHNMVDYSSLENGGDALGSTWEPDECVPDDLDKLRYQAKSAWADRQKTREQGEVVAAAVASRERGVKREAPAESPAVSSSASAAPGSRAAQAPAALASALAAAPPAPPPERKARLGYNPRSLQLAEDMSSNLLYHGYETIPQVDDRIQIKEGWPRRREDYPVGYTPAAPPGYCMPQCNCMEDWHQGCTPDPQKSWLADPRREAVAHAALEAFAAQEGIVRRRGQVSGQHYLEALHEVLVPGEDRLMADFVKTVHVTVGEGSQMVPADVLTSLDDDDSKNIVRTFGMVSAAFNKGYMPLKFTLASGPAGLCLDSGTGRLLSPLQLSAFVSEAPFSIDIDLEDIEGKVQRLSLQVLPGQPACGGPFVSQLTQRVVSRLAMLSDISLQAILRERLECVYDFENGMSRQVKMSTWARVLSDVATAAHAWRGAVLTRGG